MPETRRPPPLSFGTAGPVSAPARADPRAEPGGEPVAGSAGAELGGTLLSEVLDQGVHGDSFQRIGQDRNYG
jgi:hypothetical protein